MTIKDIRMQMCNRNIWSRTIKQLSTTREEPKQQNLMKKSGQIIAEILDDDLVASESETTIEINFAILKFKHTIKKK